MPQNMSNHRDPSDRPDLAAARPLTRRRMAALLALAPVGLLLSACATEKPHDGREHQPTYKNGQRGSGGSRGD